MLIVTVAGVLFFVMAPPTGSFVCSSSQPEKIIMKSYNFPYSPNLVGRSTIVFCGDSQKCAAWGTIWDENDPPGEMILQNGTGGPITITGINNDSVSGSDGACTYWKNFFPGAIQGQTCCYQLFGEDEFAYGSSVFPEYCYLDSDIAVPKGANIKLMPGLYILNQTPVPPPECNHSNSGFSSTHSFSIAYRDQFGYDKNVDITCQGYPPTA